MFVFIILLVSCPQIDLIVYEQLRRTKSLEGPEKRTPGRPGDEPPRIGDQRLHSNKLVYVLDIQTVIKL